MKMTELVTMKRSRAALYLQWQYGTQAAAEVLRNFPGENVPVLAKILMPVEWPRWGKSKRDRFKGRFMKSAREIIAYQEGRAGRRLTGGEK